MRLDQLRAELRPRSPWEAMELGVALVRSHARAIWSPWLLASLPVFVLFNALGWAFDLLPLAALAMWWCKPLFDRIPLFVVSRAVFGTAPRPRETLAAFARWGWRPMFGYMTWRRFGIARSLYLPIDLLEGGPQPGRRRQVIGGAARGVGAMLTLVCANFELALVCAAYALLMMFVPVEFLSESARAVWALVVDDPPRWAQVLVNAVTWLAATAIGPVYVGAGFGLYLDRRTRIEGWDIEIAFRRMRQRLEAAAGGLLCAGLLCVGMLSLAAPGPARADEAVSAKSEARSPPTLPRVFARVESAEGFGKAVEHAYADPLLSPRRKQTVWQSRGKPEPKEQEKAGAGASAIAAAVAAVGEYGLWLAMLALAVLLVATRRTWWPWLQDMALPPRREDTPATSEAHPEAEALPDDVAAAARRLWETGHGRRALALLYRASVAAMALRTGAVLVPGATEAECLRASRALRDGEDRDAFASMVRVWQHAAYAERLPAADDFEALLARLAGRFGWAAT